MGAKKSKQIQNTNPSDFSRGFPGQPPMPQQLFTKPQYKKITDNSKPIEIKHQMSLQKPERYQINQNSNYNNQNNQNIYLPSSKEPNFYQNQFQHKMPINVFNQNSKLFCYLNFVNHLYFILIIRNN